MQAKEENQSELLYLKQLMGLPENSATDKIGERIAEVLDHISVKKVPATSLSRMWLLGSVNAKLAVGYFACWLRSRFAEGSEKERLMNETRLTAALQLLSTMGYMRGAVMKVGQTLAAFPDIVPDEFAKVLGSLHFQAPPMHYSIVREIFLDEFGREPEEIFSSFERHAFAAASLGQVHRARLRTGEEVAVKVQYPDIARTIRADMRNMRILLQPMRMRGDWQDVIDKLSEIEEMLLTETDYEKEASFGREIRNHFEVGDSIVIPRIYDEYSTSKVLTTEYIRGLHLEDFLATNPNQELRDHFTHLISVATMRLFYRLHWLLADPNPGNYIFMNDGRLGLVDFGCTRVITEEEWGIIHQFEVAVMSQDQAGMNLAIAQMCNYNSPGEMEPERLDAIGRGAMWQMEPRLVEGLFDFGNREYFRRGIDSFIEATRRRFTRGKPLNIWTNRFMLGYRAMVYRLRGCCNFRKVYEEESAFFVRD